jgi:hypothetical protein
MAGTYRGIDPGCAFSSTDVPWSDEGTNSDIDAQVLPTTATDGGTMGDLQMIDLRDDSGVAGEQQRVLARLHAISDDAAARAWSDDHELELLLMRYEQACCQRLVG